MQDAHIFTGLHTSGTLCICPKLSEWVSEELRKESAVMKERRKAREERVLAKRASAGEPLSRLSLYLVARRARPARRCFSSGGGLGDHLQRSPSE